MKPTAVLVNTARGPIVDEDALHRALAERRIWAAGMDVFTGRVHRRAPFPLGKANRHSVGIR